jgi:hypothetical protein
MQNLESIARQRDTELSEFEQSMATMRALIDKYKSATPEMVCRYDHRARCTVPPTMTCAEFDCPVFIKSFNLWR